MPYEIEIGMKPEGEPGFKPVKIRWVVEQSHACRGRCRRLSKDYERSDLIQRDLDSAQRHPAHAPAFEA